MVFSLLVTKLPALANIYIFRRLAYSAAAANPICDTVLIVYSVRSIVRMGVRPSELLLNFTSCKHYFRINNEPHVYVSSSTVRKSRNTLSTKSDDAKGTGNIRLYPGECKESLTHTQSI